MKYNINNNFKMNIPKAVFNWSGGKDSSFALYKIINSGEYDVRYLITTVSSDYRRIIQHGVREELLDLQTSSIKLPLKKLYMPANPNMDTYNRLMKETMTSFKSSGIDIAIFGDIFLEDLRKFREEKLSQVKMKAAFPVWKYSTDKLIKEFIDIGFKAVVVCVNEDYLDKSFAGREIDNSFLRSLPGNVDPCGENGEFHTFVYDGPIFNRPVNFRIGEIIKKIYKPGSRVKNQNEKYNQVPETAFWYCDILP